MPPTAGLFFFSKAQIKNNLKTYNGFIDKYLYIYTDEKFIKQLSVNRLLVGNDGWIGCCKRVLK